MCARKMWEITSSGGLEQECPAPNNWYRCIGEIKDKSVFPKEIFPGLTYYISIGFHSDFILIIIGNLKYDVFVRNYKSKKRTNYLFI